MGNHFHLVVETPTGNLVAGMNWFLGTYPAEFMAAVLTTGEPMKFLTLADWTGMVETELFAQTYKSYGLATVRYPVLEVTATVEPFENGRGFSLRVLRAGKPRQKTVPNTERG